MANHNFYRDMMNLLVTKICQQSEDGRLKEMMAELGLKDEDIKLFCSLNPLQIEQLAKSRIQLFSIEINTESLAFIQRELESIRLIERCVKLGAPNNFLSDFFGLTSRDARSKRIRNVIDAKQAKRVASIEQAEHIINGYLEISQNGILEFGAKEYCDLFDKLRSEGNECSFKAIWTTVTEYAFDVQKVKKVKPFKTTPKDPEDKEDKQGGLL